MKDRVKEFFEENDWAAISMIIFFASATAGIIALIFFPVLGYIAR